MRKITTILFSVLYLLVSFSITLNLHYCNDQLQNIEFIADINECCCEYLNNSNICIDEEVTDICCEDETIKLHFEEEQIKNRNLRVSNELVKVYFVNSFYSLKNTFDLYQNISSFYFGFSPPPKEKIWIVNSSLIFYG